MIIDTKDMKNKKILFLVIFVISLFVIPEITLAVWWNPVSWKVFNRKAEVKNKQVIIATSTPNPAEEPKKTAFFDTSPNERGSFISQSQASNSNAKTNQAEKKQENTTTGGGSVINGVTSGPRPVNPVSSSSIQTKNTEKEQIIEIQKQIEKTKSQIEQMAVASSFWWKTAPSISTQTYFYQGVEIKIFVLTNAGDYRIEFVNSENNRKYLRYLKDTQANLEKGELNKKIEQIVNDDLGSIPAIAAIDGFLAKPTIDSLKLFCDKAKIILGTEQKRVLNENRTDFVMKTLTLYEQDQINNLCNLAFSIRKLKSGQYLSVSEFQAFFQWTNYDPSYVLEFNSNDSNSIREIKINFNNNWKNLSGYKLIGFHTYSTSSEIITPNKAIEKQIGRYLMPDGELSNAGTRDLRSILDGYTIPEKILMETRRQLINR